MKRALLALGALPLLVAPATAHAQWYERLSVRADGGAGALFAGANASRFGMGGYVSGRLGVRLIGPLGIQASAGGAWFQAHDNQPMGQLFTATGGLRLAGRVGRGFVGGPWADFNAGLALTGGLVRFGFDAGIGWEFMVANVFGFGPMVRFAYIAQPMDNPSPDGAPMLFGGLSLTVHIPTGPRAADTPPPPPRDSDHDGVPDAQDRCPNEPEDVDGFQDADGCPDPDNDSDGVPDAQDRCPNAAETRNGFEDDDGCPDTPPPPPVEAQPTAPPAPAAPNYLPLERQVMFLNGSAVLRRNQRPAMATVCQLLAASPANIRVIGHSDERGTAEYNQLLSARRAGTIAAALVRCGIAPERLEAVGHGTGQPVCGEATAECHQRNRRVDFELSR